MPRGLRKAGSAAWSGNTVVTATNVHQTTVSARKSALNVASGRCQYNYCPSASHEMLPSWGNISAMSLLFQLAVLFPQWCKTIKSGQTGSTWRPLLNVHLQSSADRVEWKQIGLDNHCSSLKRRALSGWKNMYTTEESFPNIPNLDYLWLMVCVSVNTQYVLSLLAEENCDNATESLRQNAYISQDTNTNKPIG